ncbi:MAG: SMI1/KNR4 family protein [Cyanobacteria bacterium P01_H01_bin.35]
MKLIDSQYLSNLASRIQTLPPDEASPLLLEASTIILFAGFPEIAYQGFLKLTEGELKVSEASLLAHPIKKIIPILCYLMKIPSPSIFSEPEMSFSELEKYINRKIREYEAVSDFHLVMPSGDTLFYPGLEDTTNTDKFIQRWWECLGSAMDGLYFLPYVPDLIGRISTGVLQNQINISQQQAQEFLDLINRRNYMPTNIGFIPTVDDWKNFLEKWNEAIFDNLDEEDRENYQLEDPNILNRKSCLEPSATEQEISELEKRLAAKLPLSYRNFLLASNGFTILNESCELYGTNEIKWFIEDEDNRDWAEDWDDDDEVEDERYFQYGEHQDCCWIRGRYMKTALQISSTEDGMIYLLNPQIIDSRNEWEAWDFGNDYPGAFRYRSFWEMMQDVYKKSLSA